MNPISSPTPAGGLPIVNDAHTPAAVRNGSKAVKQAYETAQGFEEMLIQQLSQSLLQSSGLTGEGQATSEGSGEEGSSSGSPDAGSSMLTSLLPQTFTEGIMREGGLGLTTQLMGALDPGATSPSASGSAATGGAAPAPGGGSSSAAADSTASAIGGSGGVSATAAAGAVGQTGEVAPGAAPGSTVAWTGGVSS